MSISHQDMISVFLVLHL